MAFEWQRMYKHEENIEREVLERVEEYICEYYSVGSIEEMTSEQYQEVEKFWQEYEFSIMSYGFRTVLENWTNYREEEGLDFE
jgi:hypothetical protein